MCLLARRHAPQRTQMVVFLPAGANHPLAAAHDAPARRHAPRILAHAVDLGQLELGSAVVAVELLGDAHLLLMAHTIVPG